MTMASIWSKQQDVPPPKDDSDVADTGLADVGLPPPSQSLESTPHGRPQLQRHQPQPPPPHQPPPPPAPQQIGNPNDSLSLMQLRRIVTDFPKIDPTSYAFTYSDTATFEEEVDEWFSYNEAEFRRLQRAKDTFERRWKKFSKRKWLEAGREEREAFVQREANGLLATDLRRRCKSLQTVLHIILGVWDETAGSNTDKGKENSEEEPAKTKATKPQLENMRSGIILVAEVEGIAMLFQVMQDAFKRLW